MRRHLAYLRYVLRHKWFVMLAGRKTCTSAWRLLIHDWSKFLPCEWFPYAASFYNPDGSERDWKSRLPHEKLAFDYAWLHHQKHNLHHWQSWILTNDSDDPKHKALPMPLNYIREMVADWMGAGRTITGQWGHQEWYRNNRDKMLLHPDTRLEVETILWTLSLMDAMNSTQKNLS